MADNITLNAGAGGSTVATDDCGAGGHAQIVKLAYSTDGAATPITGDAKGLQVQQATAADLNCTEASASAIKTAVELIDNSVDGNYLNVNQNIAGTDVAAGAGAVGAQVQRITLASDDPAVTSLAALDNAVDGNYLNVNVNLAGTDAPSGAGTEAGVLRVTLPTDGTGVVKLGAGIASIGKLTDDQKIDLNKIAGSSVVVGAGTEATALRITIPTDCTGLLSVDDNGASLTVDNATISVVGNGAAATAQRVTLANDSTGIVALTTSTASIGKLAANDGVDIGNVDVASIAAGTNLIGKVGIDQATANANEVVVKSGTVTAVTSITNAVAVTNADITSCKTALEIIDDWDDSNYCNVNVNIAGTDVAAGAGAVSAQTQRVTHASDDPAVTALQVIDNCISGSEAQVDVVAALPAGANLIGDVAIGPRATGGATPYSYISDGTDFVSVTDGASTLYAISCTSTDATVVYLKIYDHADAPDPSADAASIALRFAVPSAATGAGFVWNVPQGMNFANGIGFALVTGAADTDETAVTANEVMLNLVYKH
jgi:hypothetical protein